MKLAEYANYDGLGLAKLVASHQMTAKELAELMLLAVEYVNPQINSVIEVYRQRVIQMRQDELPSGSFAGVPFLLKDAGAAEEGQIQEIGSRLLRGRRHAGETFLASRFKAAGLSILGRSTVPEFTLSSSTESLLTGATHNPWRLGLMAGGSSGGAAASVAAGIVPVAHASDGAGSIRIPASCCGLVGLKPSRGRVSLGPTIGESLQGMGVEFALTRTVRDCAAMLDAVAGAQIGDPFVISQPQRSYQEELGIPTGNLRIAWTDHCWLPGRPVHPEVVEAVHHVVRTLEAMGHHLVEAQPNFDYEEYLRAICVGWVYGFNQWLDQMAVELGRAVGPDTLEAVTLHCYEQAQRLTVDDLVWAESVYNQLRRAVGEFFAGYDLLLTPTLTEPPEPLGKYSLNASDVDFLGFFRRCDESASHMPLFNLTGQPAISLPLAQSQDRLPIGIQFVAHFGREDQLLRLASVLEEALPWRDRRALIHVSR
ncbi:MAG: amidase [Caldilineaceae bacterium]